MNARTAVLSFLAVCIVLVILLLTETITPVVGGSLFAAALVIVGIASRGFTRANQRQDQSVNKSPE